MSDREKDFLRLRETLLGGKSDRVPIMEIAVDQGIMERLVGREFFNLDDKRKRLEGIVEFWDRAGYDSVTYFFAGYGFPQKDAVGTDVDSHKIVWASEQRGIIATEEDLEGYPWPLPEDNDYEQLDILSELMPSGMKLITGTNGVYEVTQNLVDNFFVALVENPEFVARVFARVGEIKCLVWERLVKHDAVGAMVLGDDLGYTGGLMVSPEILRKFVFPWNRRMGQLCREYDKPMILHSDGKLYEILDDIIDCGINALHPIEPKAMDIREVRGKTGGRLALLGHIDVDILARGTTEEVEELTLSVLKRAAPEGGYVAGSSNTVPFYVKYENFLKMNETVRKYGTYPFRL